MSNHINKPKACHDIGPRLKQLRIVNEMSVEDLAYEATVSSNFIWLLERSKTVPTIYKLAFIMEVFDVPIDTLLYADDKEFEELLEMFK